ncbi:unnamed protein product [Prunus armeniaca]
MSSHEIWAKSGGVPPSYEILKARTKVCALDNVGIDPLPLGSDIYTGAVIGLKWGVSLIFKDFIYLYDLASVRGESHNFFFTSESGKKVFTCKPTSTKYWKNQPLLITREWVASEMSNMSILFAFALKPVLPSNKRYLIPEDWIAWLEENLVGQGWDITYFLDPVTFIHLSTARRLVTYLPFILVDPNVCEINLFKDICSVNVELCCTKDSSSLIQASFQEREAELAQHNSSEDCVFGSESNQSDMSVPRSLSVSGRRERRPGKEPEPSVSAKKSCHASQVVLGLGSPNVSASSTPS